MRQQARVHRRGPRRQRLLEEVADAHVRAHVPRHRAQAQALQLQLADAQRRVEVLKQGLGGEYRAEPLEGELS